MFIVISFSVIGWLMCIWLPSCYNDYLDWKLLDIDILFIWLCIILIIINRPAIIWTIHTWLMIRP